MTFKPMLAAKAPADLAQVALPMLASPKIDGIRALIRGGQVVSRTSIAIPNAHVQALFAGLPDGLEGELVVGAATGPGVWARTQSGVMAVEGTPDVTFHAFDRFDPEAGFNDRLADAQRRVAALNMPAVRIVPHVRIATMGELRRLEAQFIADGFEGMMLRAPGGAYKQGRASTREGAFLKVKRWHDAEAMITGTIEERDKTGALKRRLGAIEAVGENGVALRVGTGLTATQRIELWKQRAHLTGQHVKYRYQDVTPAGAPRHPVFLGLRNPIDM